MTLGSIVRRTLAVSAISISLSASTFAATTSAYVVKSPNRHVAYTYTAGQPNMPTVLVFNGLLYMLSNYSNFTANLNQKGYSIIEMAYSTQPESVASLGRATPAFMTVSQRPTLEDYADEAQSVLNAVGVHGRLIIAGLSYGGGPALTFARLWPHNVSEVVLISPLAVPGDNYALQQSILDQYLTYLNMFPVYGAIWANQTKENITQYYASTLVGDSRNKFYPGVSKQDCAQGMVAMIRAAENFRLLDIDFTIIPPVHFILAEKEVPLRLQNQIDGYRKMLKQDRPGSLTVVKDAQHASTSSSPIDVANAVDRAILSGAPGVYFVDPANHTPVILSAAQQESMFREIKAHSSQPQTVDPQSTVPTIDSTL